MKILYPKKDIDKIFKRFPYGSNLHMPLVIAYYTGLRAGEVCALTWDRINGDELTIDRILINKNGHWFFTTPKTKKSKRTIKIGKTLMSILQKHK